MIVQIFRINSVFCAIIGSLFLFKCHLVLSATNTEQLDRIVVVMRHGDRAPLSSFSFDKKSNLWPAGYGHLTQVGKSRMYRIGTMLKRRYARYFPNRYISPRDVYIRSSIVDRCIESAQLVAAGLSPPISKWIWNLDLGEQWQPVPIYTVPIDDDGLLNPSSTCKRANTLYESILTSTLATSFFSTYKDVVEYVSKQANQGFKTHRDIRNLFDNLLIVKHHGERLPSWVNETIYKSLKLIFEMSFKLDYTGLVYPELPFIRSGVLVNEIFEKLDNSKTPEATNMSIYVTHDSQMSYLMDALQITLDKTLKFGTVLMFEVNKEKAVRLFTVSTNKSTEMLKSEEIKFPTCENKVWCPMKDLVRQYQDYFITIEKWKTLCQSKTPTFKHTEL